VFFARIVIPRSLSRSLESMTRSATASLARKVPDWRSMASTRVVLPWSTWAMMAMLRIAWAVVEVLTAEGVSYLALVLSVGKNREKRVPFSLPH
jgi:hypothetical protein